MSRIDTGITLMESKITFTFSSGVLYEMACDLHYAIKTTCETHWINHPDAFAEHEKFRLARLELFLNHSGYGWLFEDYKKQYQDIISAKKLKTA